ncbi:MULTISPECIES: hypothetical protein [Natrinema]|uniref:DUF7410 domain-containing protein n=1 Tax=Natrinema gari JCM 14663 TaxID=1230459 RepID=L9YUC6_9EURY|nr:hypothetical protein NJ7G_3662 [Natrinema sp. J7-2]ELY77067.1 hypothetical protein C486_16490 [Natrinema gari JCM 14663]
MLDHVALFVSGDSRRRVPEPATDTSTPPASSAPEVDVRDETPSVRCPYCKRPFRRPAFESLHRGLEHHERLSDRERAAAERAARDERAALRHFRLYALGVLVVLYFGLLIVAAVVV